jgi:DNA polymerase
LEIATDPDTRQLQTWAKAIGRDIHKMHAFVRFRQVGVDETSGREQFVAWFEPDHRIVRLAAPFFRKRFAAMDWSILTPDECVHWDGNDITFTTGVTRDAAPDGDALDELWRTYYRSIFNPARLKTRMMQSEMPKKYWKNLPEATLIGELVADSRRRVRDMLDTGERPVKPAPNNAYLQSLLDRNRNESPDA